LASISIVPQLSLSNVVITRLLVEDLADNDLEKGKGGLA
jgi:hypothetical protein